MPTSLSALADGVEARYGAPGEPTESRLSVTGEPYREFLIHSGSDSSGRPDETELFALLIAAVDHYAARISGVTKVYWRIKPEIEFEGSRGRIYARLLISATPPLRGVA